MEYLPAEIYMPNSLLGQPKQIFRFDDGTIDDFTGKDMDLYEQYTCDKCGTMFKVKAYIKFNSYIEESSNFSQEYKTQLHKAKLFLSED